MDDPFVSSLLCFWPIREIKYFLIISFSLQEYGAGRMLTGEVKQRLVQVLTEMVEKHRRARVSVTDEVNLLHSLFKVFIISPHRSSGHGWYNRYSLMFGMAINL